MRSIRKLALAGLAALLVCAAFVSSASATTPTVYDQVTGTNLAVGTAIKGTTTASSTLSGTFFGSTLTVTCGHSTVTGTVHQNSGGVAYGQISSATWSNCSSAFKNPCTVTSHNTPWGTSNEGGIRALSTTSVAVAPGTNGDVDVSDCMPFGSTCTVTGATASAGSGSPVLTNAVLFSWSNTAADQLSVSGLGKVKAKNCTASNLQWNAAYALTVESNGDKVGIR